MLSNGFSPVIEDRGKNLVISTGFHVGIARTVTDRLKAVGIPSDLLDIFKLPCDEDALAELLSGYHRIATVEEHILQGGLGSYVLEVLSDRQVLKPVKRIGIDMEAGYPEIDGDRRYMDRVLRLDEDSIFERLSEYFEE